MNWQYSPSQFLQLIRKYCQACHKQLKLYLLLSGNPPTLPLKISVFQQIAKIYEQEAQRALDLLKIRNYLPLKKQILVQAIVLVHKLLDALQIDELSRAVADIISEIGLVLEKSINQVSITKLIHLFFQLQNKLIRQIHFILGLSKTQSQRQNIHPIEQNNRITKAQPQCLTRSKYLKKANRQKKRNMNQESKYRIKSCYQVLNLEMDQFINEKAFNKNDVQRLRLSIVGRNDRIKRIISRYVSIPKIKIKIEHSLKRYSICCIRLAQLKEPNCRKKVDKVGFVKRMQERQLKVIHKLQRQVVLPKYVIPILPERFNYSNIKRRY